MNNLQTVQTIEHRNTADLIPYARNSRTHSPEQVEQLASSIKEFGFTNPVLIDAENGIIAGHGRVMAAQQVGLTTVPCIKLTHLTEAQKRAYVIADNKIALNSGWDMDMLKAELHDLQGLEFDLDLIGFDGDELEDLLFIEQEVDPEQLDHVPEVPEVPISRRGDVWLLGFHRAFCVRLNALLCLFSFICNYPFTVACNNV